MKKSYLILAAVALGLASCSNDELGQGSSVDSQISGQITFAPAQNATSRAEITGSAAADLLGKNFVVEGTKGTEAADAPTSTVVFDNYHVLYQANTAGTTESNTHNWEYAGVDVLDISKAAVQSIKYWDYTQPQYDFLAYSTGESEMITDPSATLNSGQVLVTSIATGTDLSSKAYSFTATTVDDLSNCYVSDIVKVNTGSYGDVVTLHFKNLTSKVRVGLYETVPGYAVSDVQFYLNDDDYINTSNLSTDATLFTTGDDVIPQAGTIDVRFPHIGTDNKEEADYNKASVTVTASPAAGSTVTKLAFGALTANYTTQQVAEGDGSIFLGRSLPNSTFAGSSAAQYYKAVLPNSTGYALTLRVNYTLTSIDGSGETIHVYGAKAVVPATYTKWEPNYAYTYIFKINDGTNGWTTNTVDKDGKPVIDPDDPSSPDTPAGLFPITFDAVVAEMTDANAEQTTVTTVATPSITTYQQNHKYTTDEYSIGTGKNIYVQVMDNSTSPATLVTTLSDDNSKLYKLDDEDATEAKVMNALLKQTSATSGNITGRNGLVLTKSSAISNDATKIENGVNDDPIEVAAGSAAKIDYSAIDAGTYAYVYTQEASTKTVAQYQPIAVEVGTTKTKGYYMLDVSNITEEASGVASEDYIYFSVTTNGTGVKTYSYVTTVAGKTSVAGLYKVAKTTLHKISSDTNVAVDGKFYFDVYKENDGKYAVKVIKVVA